MLTIYNTLTRKKEEFIPLTKGKIGMYVCGPTVYDVPHIGHARSAYSFDVIRKYFSYIGFDVYFVRNVTDVDDKIIKKAFVELAGTDEEIVPKRLKQKTEEIAVHYLDIYHKQLDIFGVQPPDAEPKATENIQQMIKFIEKLVKNKHGYVAGNNVYFSVESFEGYGKLSNQNSDQMMHGVRKGVDTNKRYPLDFALWKEAKPGEPFWGSPWGDGRPGWHMECSVMSTGILGEQFDVHGGGLDLIFPHHENEIAQAEAVTGKTFANYWIHNGLLTVNGEKMSKSTGNYITISDFLNKYKDPDLLKISFLMSHYRSPMDYSDEKMGEARRSKERIMIFLDKADRVSIGQIEECPGASDRDIANIAEKTVRGFKEKFVKAMDDDLNTAAAMAAIFEAVRAGNDCLADAGLSLPDKVCFSGAIRDCVLNLAGVLGLSFTPSEPEPELDREVESLIAERETARKQKDYSASDRLRKELIKKGIIVEDTPEGPVWRKI